jgi:Na+/H+ antiporter NhaD/arsenite permease-like protein
MFNALLILVFILGYAVITLEHKLQVNKAGVALLTGVFCWALLFMRAFPNEGHVMHQMSMHLGDISQVLFFLLGTMTIVEIIDAYQGFKAIPNLIRTHHKRMLLWIISFVTFFVSAVLDNVTTTIVMITIIRQFLVEKEDRMIFAGMIVIAANAGGAWSPIGDVTTTMLWIGNRVSASGIMQSLFIPSVVSMMVPLALLTLQIKGTVTRDPNGTPLKKVLGERRVLMLGILSVVFVPVLRTTTGIPPYMAVMLGMGLMWIFTDLLQKEQHLLRIPHMLSKIDITSLLFLLGILMAVAALETASILQYVPRFMEKYFGSLDITILLMGLVSAVLDNVPLTAAMMGMYDPVQFPIDSKLWEMVAYCVGTGGSILIIGSAAGVVAMGMEHIKFGWYLKRFTLLTLWGYLAGVCLIFLKYTP